MSKIMQQLFEEAREARKAAEVAREEKIAILPPPQGFKPEDFGCISDLLSEEFSL